MGKLEKAILTVSTAERSESNPLLGLDPRCLLIVTLLYLVFMLCIPADRLGQLIWFALYPIIAAPVAGISFGKVFLKSLYVLPFVLLIGIFNPIYQTEPALRVGNTVISTGWITFISLTLRGMMSVQALIILVSSTGFPGMCHALHRIGMPAFLTTQLLMLYRYLSVLLQEALTMRRAREARGYGRKTMGLRFWGEFTGQLFLRTIGRAERINRAMLSRGFRGRVYLYESTPRRWQTTDTIYLTVWTFILDALFFLPIANLFSSLVTPQ